MSSLIFPYLCNLQKVLQVSTLRGFISNCSLITGDWYLSWLSKILFLFLFFFSFPVWGGKERTSGPGLPAHHRGTGGTWGRRGGGGGGRRGHVCICVSRAETGGGPQGHRWEISTEPPQPEDHGTELQEVSEEDPGNYSHHFRPVQPQPQVNLIAIDSSACVGLCLCDSLLYLFL